MTRRRLTLAVVVVVAAAGALAGLAARRDSGGDRSPDQRVATAAPLAPQIPTSVPDGLGPAAAVELPLPGPSRPPTSLHLFGRRDAADPFADPFADGDLAVYVTDVGASEASSSDEQVTVRGTAGQVQEGFGGDQAMRAVSWMEREGQWVRVVSRRYPVDRLVEAAGALDISPAGQVTSGALPGGISLVASQEEAAVPGLGSVPVPLGGPGHVASFTSPDRDAGPQRHLAVGSYAGGDGDLLVLRWWFGDTMAPVTVAGHPAVRAVLESGSHTCTAGPGAPSTCTGDGSSTPGRTTYVMAWVDDGLVVTVSAAGVPEASVMASAASVGPATAAEWDALAAAAARRDALQQSGSGSSSGPATAALTVPSAGPRPRGP